MRTLKKQRSVKESSAVFTPVGVLKWQVQYGMMGRKEGMALKDQFGREIDYLRISVTGRCNLRCRYCVPSGDSAGGGGVLSLEEIVEIARAAAALGFRKIRVTGGEPLTRRDIVPLCRELAAVPGVEELALTTNGILLPGLAADLRAAGVGRVNISLDTLDPEKYRYITGGGALEDALAGIQAALKAGLAPLKLNAVLIGGFNDSEIPALAALSEQGPLEVRFIELMPMTGQYGPEAYLPNRAVLERLPLLEAAGISGTARLYRLPGAPGTVGLISPLSCAFCGGCNRLRLTADGFLKPCLHWETEIYVRGLRGSALREKIREAVLQKPARHGALSFRDRSQAGRDMKQIGG